MTEQDRADAGATLDRIGAALDRIGAAGWPAVQRGLAGYVRERRGRLAPLEYPAEIARELLEAAAELELLAGTLELAGGPIAQEAGYRRRGGHPAPAVAVTVVVQHTPAGPVPETRVRAAVFIGEEPEASRIVSGAELGQVIGEAMAVVLSALVPDEPDPPSVPAPIAREARRETTP